MRVLGHPGYDDDSRYPEDEPITEADLADAQTPPVVHTPVSLRTIVCECGLDLQVPRFWTIVRCPRCRTVIVDLSDAT